MLPDYPITKDKIYKKIILKRYQSIRDACLGPLAEIHVSRHFEGDLNDDGRGAREYHEVVSELAINSSELEAMTPQQVIARLDVLLLDMARQQGAFVFRHLAELAEAETGIVTASREPLNVEFFLQSLGKLYIEFDVNGQPNTSKFDFIGPQGAISFAAVYQLLIDTPEKKSRYEAIITQKREEWRGRENSRKLVE